MSSAKTILRYNHVMHRLGTTREDLLLIILSLMLGLILAIGASNGSKLSTELLILLGQYWVIRAAVSNIKLPK